ncbi:hypothetical protein Tco_0716944 [Tanacetum coccineum]
MSWYSRCSWRGGPFNGGNCRHCTNVSFRDEFVCNPDPISNDETPDFSYPSSQPQTFLHDQFHCFGCGDPLEDGVRCQRCTCKWCGYNLKEGFCLFCASKYGNSSIDVANPNSFNDLPNVLTHPPQPQYESYSCELCGNDAHYGYDCPPRAPLYSIDHQPQEDLNQRVGDVYNIWDIMIDNDESLSDEDVPKDNVKIYSNPLFEFDDEYILSTLFDDPVLMTSSNGYHDSEGYIIYLKSLLIDDIIPNLPPEVFLNHVPKNLKDEPDNEDLKSMVKVSDPGIHEKIVSPNITGGISSEWNFHVLQCLSKHLEWKSNGDLLFHMFRPYLSQMIWG